MKDFMEMLTLPVIAVIALNLLGFLYAYLRQSDKLTDLVYSLSFILIIAVQVLMNKTWSSVHFLIATAVVLWALRLGGYLFVRIQAMGRDDRFDEMRPSPLALLRFWILQAISVLVISAPVLVVFSNENITFTPWVLPGLGIFLIGFIIESVADAQKFRFKLREQNTDRLMQTGLWRKIRHPNYLGEILVWTGLFLAVMPYLQGLGWLAVISPVWIFVLLRFISGIPILEEKARKKYGDDPAYRAYIARSGRLLPPL